MTNELFTRNVFRDIVRSVLENPKSRAWTYQGFGMLRTYFTPNTRLHIWMQSLAIQGVSTLHSHPWDFESYVVCGSLTNEVWQCEPQPRPDAVTHARSLIHCGSGGGLREEPDRVQLYGAAQHTFRSGDIYAQRYDEIHQTFTQDGTVTFVCRTFRDDTEHAYVFWPAYEQWVSAEPRPALEAEINLARETALRLL